MLTRPRVLEWLLGVEEDDEHPERQARLRNGGELGSLAAGEGVIDGSPDQRDDFARMLAQLRLDGWLAWDYMSWPASPDRDPPPPQLFTDRHLQRADRIRSLPPGVEAARRGASRSQAPERPRLDPEQLDLLRRLVTAARAVDSSRQLFMVAARPPNGHFISGADLDRPVYRPDVEVLKRCEVIRPIMEWDGGMQFAITPLWLHDDR